MDDEARRLRLTTAVFVAPALGSLGCALALAFATSCPGEFCNSAAFSLATAYGMSIGICLGIPAMILIGLPVHTLLVGARRITLLPYALAGMPAGIGAALVLERFMPMSDATSVAMLAAIGAGTGAASAALFWLLRRPDLDPNLATPAS
jgi:hypothetical protein